LSSARAPRLPTRQRTNEGIINRMVLCEQKRREEKEHNDDFTSAGTILSHLNVPYSSSSPIANFPDVIVLKNKPVGDDDLSTLDSHEHSVGARRTPRRQLLFNRTRLQAMRIQSLRQSIGQKQIPRLMGKSNRIGYRPRASKDDDDDGHTSQFRRYF